MFLRGSVGVSGGKTVSGVPGGKTVSRVPCGQVVFHSGWQKLCSAERTDFFLAKVARLARC